MRVVIGPYLPEESGIAAHTLGVANALKTVGCDVTIFGNAIPKEWAHDFETIDFHKDVGWVAWAGGPVSKDFVLRGWIRNLQSIQKLAADIWHFTSPPVVCRPRDGTPVVSNAFNFQTMENAIRDVGRGESGVMRILAPVGWGQFRLLDWSGYRSSDGVVLTTPAARERVMRDIGRRGRHTPIAYIPPSSMTPNRTGRVERQYDGKIGFLLAEREPSRPRNNLETILAAFERLTTERLEGAELVVAGRGIGRTHALRLKKLEARGLTAKFVGWLRPAQFEDMLCRLHVYLSLRDIWEQASYGVVQAESYGMTVVCSQSASYADLVPSVATIADLTRVNQHSAEELSKRLDVMISSPALLQRSCEEFRMHWESNFSPGVVGSRLRDFYGIVMSKAAFD